MANSILVTPWSCEKVAMDLGFVVKLQQSHQIKPQQNQSLDIRYKIRIHRLSLIKKMILHCYDCVITNYISDLHLGCQVGIQAVESCMSVLFSKLPTEL